MTSLHSKALNLIDFSELAREAGTAAGRCDAAGLDFGSFKTLIGASVALGGRLLTAPTGWETDQEMLRALVDLEQSITGHMTTIDRLKVEIASAREAARADLHHDAEERRRRAKAIIIDCDRATETLQDAPEVLAFALKLVRQVPHDLGETYVAAYELIRGGGVLPYDGRWITGESVVHQATNRAAHRAIGDAEPFGDQAIDGGAS